MKGTNLDDLRADLETEKERRKVMRKIRVADRPIVEAWDKSAPWHTSRFENLIPAWQNAILRFGRRLLEGGE